jgi:hypothetical protein
MFSNALHVVVLHRRKTLYIKIKDKDPSIKNIRQMRTRVDTTQRKKNKQSMKNKEKKTLCKYDPRL